MTPDVAASSIGDDPHPRPPWSKTMTIQPVAEPPLDQPYYGAPFDAVARRFVKKAFVYTGRASRSEYWKTALLVDGGYLAVEILLTIAGVVTVSMYDSGIVAFLSVVGLLVWIAFLAGSVMMISVGVRRLHDAGRSGLTLLFALIPFAGPIITLVFLLQPSDPRGARFDGPPGGRASFGAVVPGMAYEWPVSQPYAAPAVPSVPPVPAVPAAEFATSSGGFAAPTVPSLPPAPAIPTMAVPPVPAAPIQAVPGIVPPAPPVPVAPPMPEIVAPAADDGLDATRITVQPTGSWRIVLTDGRQIALGCSARLGRDPGADPSDPSALLIPLDDAAKSISKTHAALSVTEDGVLVTDLHSTNGTVVRFADGTPTVLAPGAPFLVRADAELRIGEYTIRLGKEAGL
ncbi:DUF805 domain-containing protein [Microbacterium capsulatum]|uniref:DUF805 domain-containing protein n=1 Tax=Microbacterium capsulatum TaxID=3041921 RepID=A0ABU0XH01_9MICO|nr:DUF805 domain-containing protein [Microbacterium sp. ASV81]MDQ4213450.1 DUF805 domain-containing protein [Microbacterium sp. ASV81]